MVRGTILPWDEVGCRSSLHRNFLNTEPQAIRNDTTNLGKIPKPGGCSYMFFSLKSPMIAIKEPYLAPWS